MAQINDIINEPWSIHDHGEIEDALKQEIQILRQSTGTPGPKGDKGDKGESGQDGQNGQDGQDGQDGADGKSAYQSYYDTTSDNPKMTEGEWAAAILRSAYRSYLATTSDNPKKTESEWVASLKGQKGETGATGSQGQKGDKGDKGDTGDTLLVDGNFNPVTDIVNDMTTGGANKAWSAEMGKQLSADVDDIPVIDIHVDGRKLVINTNAALAPRVIVGNLSKSALSCRAGQTDTATFKVSGRRLTAAITAALSDSTYFSISPASISPSSGVVEETTLTVTYNPGSGATAGTSHSLTITIASDGVTYGTLQLTGTVAAAPSITLTPVSLTIGTESGQSGTGTINVKGTALDGDISLAISGSGFSLSDNLVSKAEAESAGGKDITVTFDGSADGATGTITASSTGATSVEASVSGSVRERLAVGGTITEGNLLYTVLTGQLTVSVQKAATAPSGAVTIPSTVYDSNGFDYSVVSIPTQGFSGAQITSISLPDTLKDIGKNAFFNCNSLTSIDLGDGVETIDDNAFYGTRLTSITFPDSLRGCKGCLASTPLLTTIQFGKTTAFSPPVDGNGIKVAMKNAGSTTSTTGSANTIETIICYATNPPTITDIPVNLDGATLKVPSGSITAYTNASKWNEIGTIEAI